MARAGARGVRRNSKGSKKPPKKPAGKHAETIEKLDRALREQAAKAIEEGKVGDMIRLRKFLAELDREQAAPEEAPAERPGGGGPGSASDLSAEERGGLLDAMPGV